MRIGIVYSETSAKLAYSEDIYSKLFMAAQTQAMMAGIPFDILSEADLTDINKVNSTTPCCFRHFKRRRRQNRRYPDHTHYGLPDLPYRYGRAG